MLRLSFPEFARGFHLCHDLSRPKSRRIHVGDGFSRDPFLFIACVKNGRTVTGSDVISLAIERGRIANLEKILKQFAVAQLLGIEDDFDRLGVAAVVALSCIWNVTAAVADSRRDHARVTSKEILHTPETSAR